MSDDLQRRVEALEFRQDLLERQEQRTSKTAILGYVQSLPKRRYGPMWIHMAIAILPVAAVLSGVLYGYWWPLAWWVMAKQTFVITEVTLREKPLPPDKADP